MQDLVDEFWDWRAATQPDSSDDITRVQRPSGWNPSWSPDAVAERRRALAAFMARYGELEPPSGPVSEQVNRRLLGSALARAHWELELLRGWQRNPCFYLDQSLVPIFNALLEPPPFDPIRSADIAGHLNRVPAILADARDNLADHAAAPFARYAIGLLEPAEGRLREAMAALAPLVPDLDAATDAAAAALTGFRDWLAERLPSFTGPTAVGREAFGYFLHRVALLPYPADRLRAMGRQEWDRAVSLETILRQRHGDTDPALPDLDAHIDIERADELAVRHFYTDRGLLTQPEKLRHYRFAAMPAYLAPLEWLGVAHYTAAPDRRDEDAIRYVPAPRPDLPYFSLAAARDPRTMIVHEGVHAQQLALSWAHPDPARRRYYDSAANEGVAFYNEELMLLSGLFDAAPASAVFVANAMRLRALRVEVDIALATSSVTLDEAAEQLATAVPMDRQTAWEEAVFFAGNPGQGLSYQIGKLQILDLLATWQRRQGAAPDLREFHDRLWLEGNVPLALQRWELLGDRTHLDQADQLALTP